jgi:alpha-1,2-mannosyltransferase
VTQSDGIGMMATPSTDELPSPSVSSSPRRDVATRPRSAWRWLADHAWWILPVVAFGFVTHQLWDQTYWQRLDFHIYTEAVASWSRSSSIYDYAEAGTHLGFTYPTFAAVVLWPVAHLDRALAEHLWMMASLLASLAFLVIAGRALPDPPRWRGFVPAFVAAGLLTTPVVLTTRLGQINSFLALVVLVDCLSARRPRPFTGVGVGLASAIKLTPMVGVLFFAVARRWRAVATTVAAFAGATLVAWVVSPSDSRKYWTDTLFDTSRVGGVDSPLNNSLRRAVTWLHAGNSVESIIWVALALAVVAVGVWRARLAWDRGNDLASITVVMCVGLLVAPITWSHHLYFLILALPLLIGDGRSWARWAAFALTLPVMFELHDQGQRPAQSGLRILLLLLVVVALPLDRSAEPVEGPAGEPFQPLEPLAAPSASGPD